MKDTSVQKSLSRTPLKKVASPKDIASQIVVLASPILSGHVTGQNIMVEGGRKRGQGFPRHRTSLHLSSVLRVSILMVSMLASHVSFPVWSYRLQVFPLRCITPSPEPEEYVYFFVALEHAQDQSCRFGHRPKHFPSSRKVKCRKKVTTKNETQNL